MVMQKCIDEEYLEWAKSPEGIEYIRWIDSLKETDGTIDLSKHPEFFKQSFMAFPQKFEDLPKNIGDAVNFDIPTLRHSDE